jgi:DNA polymerase/3'-5' exonuclease PolX
MTASNATIADDLRRYAAALSVEGADRFKLKAYRRAAETIEGLRYSHRTRRCGSRVLPSVWLSF